MAHDVLHLLLLEQVESDPRLPREVASLLRAHSRWARAGSLLIDMPYFEGFGAKVLAHLRHRPEAPSPWGDRFHQRIGIGLVRALLDVARDQRDPAPLQAVALGHLTHAVLDLETHPHVNRFVAKHAHWESDRPSLHRRVENVQAELWHRHSAGGHLFGTRRMRGLGYAGTPFFTDPELVSGLSSAIRLATGEAPSLGSWRRWSLGLGEYALVVASPVGLAYFDARDLDAFGSWFAGPDAEFAAIWERAVTSSIVALSGAWEQAKAEHGLERSAFAQRFPERNLDDPPHAPLPT